MLSRSTILLSLLTATTYQNTFVSAENICPYVPVASPAASYICGSTGRIAEGSVIQRYVSPTNDRAACLKACMADYLCLSFSYQSDHNSCNLFKKWVKKSSWTASPKSPSTFWDRNCFAKSAACGQVSSAPNTVTSSAIVTASADSTSTGEISTDSPPLASSSVEFPTDRSWTATYTYDEQILPTFAPDPIIVFPKPTYTPICFIDPAVPGNKFFLLDPSGGFLVDVNGKPGPPAAPKNEAAAVALGPAKDYVPPSYTFVKAAGAAEGLYDLMLVGSNPPLYLAKVSTGDVIFTDSSTNGQTIIRKHKSIITTVFGVTCDGHMTVRQGNTSYIWRAAGGYTTVTPGTALDGIVILPTQARGMTEVTRRDSKFTTGAAPRCPGRPDNVHGQDRLGVRRPEGNGCGPANGIDFVPDFNFGSCCDDHDKCFDNCAEGLFEGCNDIFHSCMRGTCGEYDHWWSYFVYVGCLGLSDFYAWAVTTQGGRDAYASATAERCECACDAWDSDLCMVNGSPKCIPVRVSDPNNCGACGATCPHGTHCSDAKCVCSGDSCGNMCLNFNTHPRNCGRCGNVCQSGYCWQGQCYTPPPNVCAPIDGFTNGGFGTQDLTGWTLVNEGDHDRVEYFDQDTGYCMKFEFLWRDNRKATLSQNVKICPGINYEMTFQAIRIYGMHNCQLRAKLGERTILDWTSLYYTSATSWVYFGQFLITPFSVGDPQTAVNGLGLEVPFEVEVTCKPSGNSFSELGLDNFAIYPA